MKYMANYSLSAAFVAALLSVSSAANAQDNNEVTVKDATIATFEDLTLESESSRQRIRVNLFHTLHYLLLIIEFSV